MSIAVRQRVLLLCNNGDVGAGHQIAGAVVYDARQGPERLGSAYAIRGGGGRDGSVLREGLHVVNSEHMRSVVSKGA